MSHYTCRIYRRAEFSPDESPPVLLYEQHGSSTTETSLMAGTFRSLPGGERVYMTEEVEFPFDDAEEANLPELRSEPDGS